MEKQLFTAEYEDYKQTVLKGGLTPRTYPEYVETLCMIHARTAESQRKALVELLGLPEDTSFEVALGRLGAPKVVIKGTRFSLKNDIRRLGTFIGMQKLLIKFDDGNFGEWISLNDLVLVEDQP